MAQWHPFFVHFSIALLLVSTVFLVLGCFFPAKAWSSKLKFAGYVNLWLGASLTVLSVIAGIDAFNTVTHDTPAHIAMKDHRVWALGTAALAILLALWSFLSHRKGQDPGNRFLMFMLVLAVGVFITGGKGANLVYTHGLAVASLPDASNHDHGSHDHGSHDHGEDADHDHELNTDTPLSAVRAFHHALDEGNEAAVQAVLMPDVMIFESGYAERSFEEYKGHHMPADMAFAKAVSTNVSRIRVTEDDAMAWVVSDRHTQGEWNGKTVNSLTLETIILRKVGENWRIAHVHWSARPAPDDLGDEPVEGHSDDHEH